MPNDRPLTPLDAAFLHIETDRTPMHMASVGIFEAGPLMDEHGDLRVDDVRRLITSRLDRVPKLRQRARPGLFGQAPFTWGDDPDFDIGKHVVVRRITSPGTEAQLGELCGEILSTPLDRSRPLWELVFVVGLEGDRVALVEKLHHSMADGIAAAELATVLLDVSPDGSLEEATPWTPMPASSAFHVAARDLQRLVDVSLRVPAWIGWSALHPLRRARSLGELGRAAGTLVTQGVLAPRSPLNRQISGEREVHFVRMGLDEVKDIAHRHGATVNDVVLTVVAGGLRRLLESRTDTDGISEQQVLVPVGLDAGTDRGMGNRVSALFVKVPVGEPDPVLALKQISAETATIKGEHEELAAARMMRLLDPLPQAILSVVTRMISFQPFFNLIVTNVPGPSFPLYVLGAPMVEAFPIVPLAGNQGMGIAALSYLGNINLGVFSDPDVCPDVEAFCVGAEHTLRELTRRSRPRAAAKARAAHTN